MINTLLVETLLDGLEKARFDPLRVRPHLSDKVFFSVSAETYFFFEPFGHSLEYLASEKWFLNAELGAKFDRLDPMSRFEVISIISSFVHEYTHKMDLLTTPMGAQHTFMMIDEYLLMQDYLPHALDLPKHFDALSFRWQSRRDTPNLDITQSEFLSEIWPHFDRLITRQMGWGDIGDQNVDAGQINPGWQEAFPDTGSFFFTNENYRLLNVRGDVFSFAPTSDKRIRRNWFVRPLTILEGKAVAHSLLYLASLPFEGIADDIVLFYRAFYAERRNHSAPDYLFVLDTVSQQWNKNNFDDIVEARDLQQLRAVLRTTQLICWFAMHAPAPINGDTKFASDPNARLFVALRWFSEYMLDPSKFVISCPLDMGIQMGESKICEDLGMPSIIETIDRTKKDIKRREDDVKKYVWDLDIKDWFTYKLGYMRRQFGEKDQTGVCNFSFPSSGSPFAEERSQADQVFLMLDYEERSGVEEWLKIRKSFFFDPIRASDSGSEPILDLARSHFAFVDNFVSCDKCDEFIHHIRTSKKYPPEELYCPKTGQAIGISETKGVDF